MKTFNDLDFEPLQFEVGIVARIYFNNGYGASVVQSQTSYGGDGDLYELAILKNRALCYNTHITDDVLGHLTEDQVSDYLRQVQEL